MPTQLVPVQVLIVILMEAGPVQIQSVNVMMDIGQSKIVKKEDRYVQVCVWGVSPSTLHIHYTIFLGLSAVEKIVCAAQSVSLARYPTTMAPLSGSVTVYAECADNSHRASSSLSIMCTSTGSWSGNTPQCECDTGYYAVDDSNHAGKQICKG